MNAKKLAILLPILFITVFTKAQDTILRKNGGENIVRITKITDNIVEFKSRNEKDKRVFFFKTKRVFGIKFQNGNLTSANGVPISAMDYDYEKYSMRGRSKFNQGLPMVCIGASCLAVGIGVLSYGIHLSTLPGLSSGGYMEGFVTALYGAIVIIPGIPLTIVGSVKTRSGKKYKRLAKELKPTIGFNPILSPEINFTGLKAGMGMRIVF